MTAAEWIKEQEEIEAEASETNAKQYTEIYIISSNPADGLGRLEMIGRSERTGYYNMISIKTGETVEIYRSNLIVVLDYEVADQIGTYTESDFWTAEQYEKAYIA